MTLLAIALASYLLGSFPAGYLAGRIAGVDVRTKGSGNIGATNVTRVLGKHYGYPVFAIDFLKGLGAVELAVLLVRHPAFPSNSILLSELTATVSCVLGHSFPVWLGFRGGKGVATSAGALFRMMPVAALIVMGVWILIFLLTRFVSVASIAAAISLPVTVAIRAPFKGTDGRIFFVFCTIMAALIVLRHRSNLSRLMSGTEPRFRKSEDQ